MPPRSRGGQSDDGGNGYANASASSISSKPRTSARKYHVLRVLLPVIVAVVVLVVGILHTSFDLAALSGTDSSVLLAEEGFSAPLPRNSTSMVSQTTATESSNEDSAIGATIEVEQPESKPQVHGSLLFLKSKSKAKASFQVSIPHMELLPPPPLPPGASINISCPELGISKLTTAMIEDPEKSALRPLQFGQVTFPGLDVVLNAIYRRHTIYLLGDSTLFYPFKWIKALLRSNATVLSALPNMDLSDANIMINPTEDKHAGQGYMGTTIAPYQNASTSWTGTIGMPLNAEDGLCNFRTAFDSIRNNPPEIIVANFGLHWLHFHGEGRNMGPDKGCEIIRWIRYEGWLEEIWNLAEEVGAKILLYKTNNRICFDKYEGKLLRGNKLYSMGDRATLDRCFEELRRDVPVEQIEDEDVRSYCANGTFNENGVARLNDRIARFVQERNGDRRKSTGLKVAIFNDHDTEKCSYTRPRDGRHYHTMNLLRIRLLGNVLQCML